MNSIKSISQESLILGMQIEELYEKCSTNKYYEEYDNFVGDLLNQFYEHVLNNPNNTTIRYKLDFY